MTCCDLLPERTRHTEAEALAMVVVLFVGNLFRATTAKHLVATFAQAGTVERARLLRHPDTHRPRRFGFVEMASLAEARQAIRRFDGYQLGGRPPRVAMAADQRGAGGAP